MSTANVVPSNLQSTSSIKLWTPTVIGLMTFFLGFPSGIVLASINWIRMDLKGKAFVHIVGGIVGILATRIFPVGTGQLLGFIINIGYMTYLHQEMKNDIDRVADTNLQYVHWFSALLISIATTGTLVIVALVLTVAKLLLQV